MKVIYLPHYACDEIVSLLHSREEFLKVHVSARFPLAERLYQQELDRLKYYIETIENADDLDEVDEIV